MSEVDTRPATRGRSSHRGGRGGFGRGGPRGGRKQVNGASSHDAPAIEEVLADEGELGDMKRQYASELPTLKELFPDWTDVDLIFALQESDGDMTATIEKISQGNVSQFSEVKKVKDRARSKVKEEPATTTEKTVSGRGGRGRGGIEGSRGRGGRVSDRGRGGHRGGRGGHATTDSTTKGSDWTSVPTTESSAWSKEPSAGAAESANWGDESKDAAKESKTETSSTEPAQESTGAVAAIKKTWASMFASKPTPPAEKSEKPVEKSTDNEPPPDITTTAPEATTAEPILTEATKPAILASNIIGEDQAAQTPEIPPSTVPLTEENVEHLPDESHPPATQTAASTVGSNDPRNLTPLPSTQQPPIARPQLGGFATSAHRAASGSFRSASYQRRVQEQQEAVVMPGHNAVDRTAVQFGSMGLNESSGLDVDDEREEIETRQAPQHSPPSQPKTSLPPPSKSGVADVGISEALPTKQAPGLPPASQQNQPSSLNQDSQDQSQLGYQQGQYGNYAQSGLQQDAQQKQYDPFGHQTQHNQYDRFGSQHQGQQQQPQSQHQNHSGFGGLGSAPHDYNSSYYGSEAQRNAYGQYYGGNNQYAGHDGRSQAQQDTSLGQQRSASGYGSAPNESGFGSQQAQQTQARYGEAANSGHSTPNPHAIGQQGNNAQQSAMHQQATQQQRDAYAAAAAAGFPYGHPYFNSPYQQAYQNQFGYSQYGAGYPSKQGGGYNAPYGQQMGSQPSYDQHSTSGGSGSFSQSQGQQSSMRTASGMSSSLGGGLDEYGRSTSQSQGSGFGGINDPFGRNQSGYSQAGYNAQTSTAGPEDALKPYADQKAGSSPSLGQPGRPASAANNQANANQQQAQGGFGGYQGFQGQSNQYAGLGGLGGHQQGQANQQGGYSGYNNNAFAQYGSYNNRGGWGQSYGAH